MTSNHLPASLQTDAAEKWDAFCSASNAVNLPPPDDPDILDALEHVFALSDFVAESCTREPRIFDELIRSGDLLRKYPPQAYANRLSRLVRTARDEAEFGRMLRSCRCREMIRIAWRDLSGGSDLFETIGDLSAFADACLDESLTFLYGRLIGEYGTPMDADGTPQHLVVIGMGKLGGTELNFSSDIDLIFAYPEAGRTQGKDPSIRNDEFFTHLCRRLIHILGETSLEGRAFRVDLRLRPDGESGPLVMSFDNMEDYYQHQGREWERYAWIKARIVAGDKDAGKQLLERLKPFVFRRYLDFGAFDSLRQMKEAIAAEVKLKRMTGNIKLGSGGIREIEFFGQAFQLIRGGVTPALQKRGILDVLETLVVEHTITGEVGDELSAAYIFLRTTEHRLQEVSDQQTHDLPSGDLGKTRLASAMGFEDWESFSLQLEKHRNQVHDHFNGLLATSGRQPSEDSKRKKMVLIWQDTERTDQARKALISTGYTKPVHVLNLLEHLRNDAATRSLSSEGRKRLNKLMPLILDVVGASERPTLILGRIVDLIKTIERRTSYLSLLLENPSVLTHLVKLSDASPWIISFLAEHPVLLDELLDPRTLYSPPDRTDLEQDITRRLSQIPADDLEYQIEQLCIFKQVNTLRVSAADVTGALPLMHTSDHLTDIAEIVLDKVLDLSWRHLVERHGSPVCSLDNTSCDRGFAVIAYGKLGGIELGYASDLDLVFLHAGSRGQTGGGRHPIDNGQFFSRLGQRVIHILTAHTRAGRIYEIDMRLRPSGDAGLLVSHIEGFKDYQLNQAWTWEHQALIRARATNGDANLSATFEETRKAVLARPRDKHILQKEVSDMRERMRAEAAISAPDYFDLKQDTGGIVDIEFLVQYLVLLNAHTHPELTAWTDNVRLLGALTETGVVGEDTAQVMKNAYLTYRSATHRLSLQEQNALAPAVEFRDIREPIIRLWNTHLKPGA